MAARGTHTGTCGCSTESDDPVGEAEADRTARCLWSPCRWESNPGGKLYFETIKIITQGIILFSINLYVLC